MISDRLTTSAIVLYGTAPSSSNTALLDIVRFVKQSPRSLVAAKCFWRFLAMFKPIEPVLYHFSAKDHQKT
jgi:hypothetical protein